MVDRTLLAAVTMTWQRRMPQRQPAAGAGEHGKCYYHGEALGSGIGEGQTDHCTEWIEEFLKYAIAVNSLQHGYCTIVSADAVGDRADGPHRANLFDIDMKYGDVVETNDVLTHLSDNA